MKEGSIVALNCGGPLMTVEMIDQDATNVIVNTVWFVNDIIHRYAFTKQQLILIRE